MAPSAKYHVGDASTARSLCASRPPRSQNVVRSAETASLPATSTPNAASAIPGTVAEFSITRVRPVSVRFLRTGAWPCRKNVSCTSIVAALALATAMPVLNTVLLMPSAK